ncbi:hypothetical protein Tco_1447391 [Tanacetum coccineum]
METECPIQGTLMERLSRAGAEGPIPPKTAEQKLAMKNELKAKALIYQHSPESTYRRISSQQDANSTNETFNTAHSVSVVSSKDQASTASYADDVMFSFFANQSNAPQLDNEDLEQIDADDLEEMDLKGMCNAYHDSFKSLQIGEAEEGITNFALMAYTSQGSSSSDSEVHTCSKDCLKSYETLQKQYDQQREALNKSNLEIIGYQMGLESLEARIVVHEKNEAVYEEDIAFLKYDVQVKDISIKDLKNQLEEALKEKDDLKLKLEKFEESSKNLTKLINSQISAKDKAGLGYDSQINKSEVVHSVFNSRESDVDNSPVNDRFKTGEGFHAVPPPYTGNYMPLRPDLSFVGLDDSVYKTKVSETETSISKTSKDIVEKPKTVRPSAPIIEDWDTDSDNDSVFRPKTDQTKPKFTKINFVKSDENVKSVNKENTHKQVEYPRKSQSPRGNRRNWNGMMTQKLGNGFEFIKKACFVCGSFNHLIKDCDFHDNKMRVNHQSKLTHPHPKRNFIPTAIATKSGQVSVNAAKQSSPRAIASISTVRPGNQQSTFTGSGIFVYGCSRHMTGNKFSLFLLETGWWFGAFGGSPKGVKLLEKGERNGKEKVGGASNKEGDQNVQDFRAELDNMLVQQKEGYATSTNRVSIVSPSVSATGQSFD